MTQHEQKPEHRGELGMDAGGAGGGNRCAARDKWSLWISVSRTPDDCTRIAISDEKGWKAVDICPDHARWLADELVSTAARCDGGKAS